MDTPKEEEQKEEAYPMHHMARKMMMAGLGVMDMLSEHVNKMIVRGEDLYKNRESKMEEMKARRKKFMEKRQQRMHDFIIGAMDEYGFPKKEDIDKLNTQISSLEKKVDALSKKKE